MGNSSGVSPTEAPTRTGATEPRPVEERIGGKHEQDEEDRERSIKSRTGVSVRTHLVALRGERAASPRAL
jgi:hypothetical protein